MQTQVPRLQSALACHWGETAGRVHLMPEVGIVPIFQVRTLLLESSSDQPAVPSASTVPRGGAPGLGAAAPPGLTL